MHKDIKISDIALSAKSEREVYHMLTIERDIYLFPMVDPNRKYMQNIMSGNKKFLYGKNIKAVKVSHIEQLSIKDLLNWRIESTEINLCLQHTNTVTKNDSVMFQMHWIMKAFKSHQKFIKRKKM